MDFDGNEKDEKLFDEYCSQEDKMVSQRNEMLVKLAHQLNLIPLNEAVD